MNVYGKILVTFMCCCMVFAISFGMYRRNHPEKAELTRKISSSCNSNYIPVDVYSYQLKKKQTDGHPKIGAWGDTLKHGDNSVAISRDLLDIYCKYDTLYLIMNDKLCTFVVRDVMKKSHSLAIDVLSKDNFKCKGVVLVGYK